MNLAPAERELLNAAEQNARRALSRAREAAETIVREAYAEATALLMQQHEAASLLLLQKAEESDEVQEAVEAEADGLSEPHSEALLEGARWDSEQLLLIQQHTADMLRDAQREASAKLSDAMQTGAVNAMMAGQREAAAFILEARMRIEADRAAQTRSG